MLEVISIRSEAETAQSRFQELFARDASIVPGMNVGFQSGTVLSPVYWRSDAGLWGLFRVWPLENPTRYWNAFGVVDPSSTKDLNITCEINPPLSGIDRQNGGAFVRDSETEEVYVMHSGKIGGGRAGINMSLFWANWPDDQTFEVWDGRSRKMALVCCLDRPSVIQELGNFVTLVAEMKASVYPNR